MEKGADDDLARGAFLQGPGQKQIHLSTTSKMTGLIKDGEVVTVSHFFINWKGGGRLLDPGCEV